MLLFIFESIGTSELIMIGIVALIFLGPRRMPEIAKKIGKIMSEFRSTTQDFKSTWEREVNFEEESKLLQIDTIEKEAEQTNDENGKPTGTKAASISEPVIKEIDKESFERISREQDEKMTNEAASEDEASNEPDLLSDKRTWL